MKRFIAFLVTVVLASSLISVTAEAHRAENTSHRSAAESSHRETCYTPDEISKYPPWPPYCH